MLLAPVEEGISPLLETKLFIPAARAQRLSRPRLVAQLDFACALTLVSAPAGFGKTTLVSDWIRAREPAFGWLSLDPADSDLRRFSAYLARVIDGVSPGAGQRLRDFLAGPRLPPVELLFVPLINELAARQDELVLVFDDYHVIDSPGVHAAVELLVERLPPGIRVILTTRTDPPFALPRLRARGLLQEIRPQQLRLSRREVLTFLRDVMDLPVEPAQAATLWERTEGWVTGLQLAALSLRGRPDVATFVDGFTETNRFVIDYLSEEVFLRQPREVLDLLLALSVPERFCGSLCEALTGISGGQGRLGALEAENLFLVPLDDHRCWYRFHHLFRSLLQDQVAKRHSATELRELHRRATDWFLANDLPEEALEHALAAEDRLLTSKILRTWAGPRLRQGDIGTVMAWFDALPNEWLGDEPRLVIDHALALFLSFRWNELLDVLQNAARLQIEDPSHPLAGELATLKTFLATALGEPEKAIVRARKAMALLPEDADQMRGGVAVCLCAALISTGSYAEVRDLLRAARRLHRAAGDQFALTFGEFLEGHMDTIRGHLHRASELFVRKLARVAELKGVAPSVAAVLQVGQAEVLVEQGELETAAKLVEGVVGLGIQASPVAAARALAILLSIHRSRHEMIEALAAADLLDQLAEGTTMPAWDLMQETHRARIWVLEARLSAGSAARERLAQWVEDHRLLDPEQLESHLLPDHPREAALLCAVRWLLIQGDNELALTWLARIRDEAEKGEWFRAQIETWLLEAQARAAESESAAAALREALLLAAPEGFVQVVLDEVPWLTDLLTSYRGGQLIAELPGPFRDRLVDSLQRFGGSGDAESDTESAGTSPAGFDESSGDLTEREIEVLTAIAEGLTNLEAGRRLFISSSTVKKHLENIYRKLGAHNRVEAIARCREIGLLAARLP